MWVGVTVLALLLAVCQGEEWYMPDSRLISDQEWRANVKEKGGFKMVKYFTPHCPYCRYLKAAVDILKHEKQWCFEIYDLNCQWYPQFCMQEVKSTSFPYTAIYDAEGNLNEEIHGFYPEPVLRTIFQRIEGKCVAARDGVHPGEQKPASSGLKQEEEHKEAEKVEEPAHHEQANNENPEDQARQQSHQNRVQSNEIQQEQEGTIVVDGNPEQTKREQSQAHTAGKPTKSYHHEHNIYHYVFYALTIFLGAYYFKYIHQHSNKQNHNQHHKTPKPHKPHLNPQPFQRSSPSLKDNLTQNS